MTRGVGMTKLSGKKSVASVASVASAVAATEAASRKLVFLLSPAKSVNFDRDNSYAREAGASSTKGLNSPLPQAQAQEPPFPKQTTALLGLMKQKSKKELKSLMSVSDNIAELNYQRYQNFEESPLLEAAVCFDGQAYKTLRSYDMTTKQLRWLNERLLILSGFYGLVRPLDQIRAYRLEMGTKLKTDRGNSLYAFWGDSLTDFLAETLNDGDVVVNTASQEYSKSINWRILKEKGIPCFEMKFPGPAVHAKSARGAIVRYACENEIDDVDALKEFSGTSGEYEFVGDSDNSGFKVFTFVRSNKGAAAKKRKR